MAEIFTPDYFIRRSQELSESPQAPAPSDKITPDYFRRRSQELQAQALQAPTRPDLSAISPSGPGTPYPTPAPAPPPPSNAGGLRGLFARAVQDISDQTGGPRGILPRMAEGIRVGAGESGVTPQEMQQYPALGGLRRQLELPGRILGGELGGAAGLISGLAEKSVPGYPGIPRGEADRLMRDVPGVGQAVMMAVGESAPQAEGLRAPSPQRPIAPGPIGRQSPPTLNELAARVGVPRGEPPPPEQLATSVGGGIRDVVAREEAARQAALDAEKTRLEGVAATRPEGQMKVGVLEGLGTRVSSDMARTAPDMVVDALTPQTGKALDYLNAGPSKFIIQNKIGPQLSAGERADIAEVSLAGLKQIRDNLVKFQAGARHPNDVAAMEHLINTFDTRLTQAVTDGLFSGDKDFLVKWKNADKAPAEIKALFEGKPAQDTVLAKITDPDTPKSQILNYLLGSAKIGNETTPVKLWNQFSKSLPPEKLQEWREAMFDHAVKNEQVRALARSEIGKEMYDPPTRLLMDRYVEVPKEGKVRLETAVRALVIGYGLEEVTRHLVRGTGLGRLVGPMMRKAGEFIGRKAPSSYGGTIGQ